MFKLRIGSACDAIYSTKLLREYNLSFPPYKYEDTFWFFISSIVSKRIACVREDLYTYRRERECSTMSLLSQQSASIYQVRIQLLSSLYRDWLLWLQQYNVGQYQVIIDRYIIQVISDLYLSYRKVLIDTDSLQDIVVSFSPEIYSGVKELVKKKRIQHFFQSIFSITKKQKKSYILITILGITISIRRKHSKRGV